MTKVNKKTSARFVDLPRLSCGLDILDRMVKELGDAERIAQTAISDARAHVNCGGSDPRKDGAAIPEPIL